VGVAETLHNQLLTSTRMKLKWFFLLIASLAVARAQGNFHAVCDSEVLLEGGRVDRLTVVSGDLKFQVRPPKDWSRHVDEAAHQVLFTSPSGNSALTVEFTTASPGVLPEDDALRQKVLRAHPGAGIVQKTVCPTGYRPGVLFDLVHLVAPHVVQKIRHAYVAEPAGNVEFVLSSSEDEYPKTQYIFMATAGAFRVDRLGQK
jgi:hypothetical protein